MASHKALPKHSKQPPILKVKLQTELHEVRKLREREYATTYPSIDVFDDPYDETSLVFFSRDEDFNVQSTARLALDGPFGLPEDKYWPPQVSDMRRDGSSLMELGRFIIHGGNRQLLKSYYRTFHDAAVEHGADFILMAMKPKDVALHQRIMGAKVLTPDMGVTYGGRVTLACVAWDIGHTQDRFFDWVGGVQ